MAGPSLDDIRRAPKVLLHDHLDGGVRPGTIVELAAEHGYDALPTTDVDALAHWFEPARAAESGEHSGPGGDLVRYLAAFEHTVGVMQTPDALERVAYECAADLAADGVVYAEVRFAPEQHLRRGLTLDDVVKAVLAGFRAGSDEHGIVIGTLVGAMRQHAQSLEIAHLAVRHRDAGVVGFDIAGPEDGFPPTRHLDAFQYVQRENFHTTIHAGEAFGLPSIWEALQWCGAERLGHGVRIMDDIAIGADGDATLGRLANFVRDRRVPLEMCPTSNVHTGVCASVADHPIGLLKQLQFRVTVNTDNRLMSAITLSEELHRCVDAFGWGWDDIRWLTINAMKSAFWPFDDRLRLINDVIKPGFVTLTAA